MIIFGIRTSSFRRSDGTVYDCRHCQSASTVNLLFATRYFHIFWIPVIPLGKTGVSQCSHCKETLYRNEMPAAIGMEYPKVKCRARTPLKFFTGLLLVALFVVVAVVAAFTDRSRSQDWIKEPRPGDVYEVREDEGYTLYRVASLYRDSVTIDPHEYMVERSSQLRKLRNSYPGDYDEEARFRISRKALQTLYDNRVIRKVDR